MDFSGAEREYAASAGGREQGCRACQVADTRGDEIETSYVVDTQAAFTVRVVKSIEKQPIAVGGQLQQAMIAEV